MSGTPGKYSNIIVYDEKRRYYYLWPQKNRPLLDDEVRSMGVGLLDRVRRSVQTIYGDVASPNSEYSKPNLAASTEAFKVKALDSTGDKDNNFIVSGGSSLDNPAVLYANGFYIFITGDIEYKKQMVSSSNYDLNTATDKTLTQTLIPDLSTPTSDRADIVYIDLHFEEVTAKSGVDDGVYLDSGLKNSIVGTETANRLRAVIDVRVYEDWSALSGEDFSYDSFISSPLFLGPGGSGGIINPDNPVDNHYRVPIAMVYRKSGISTIESEDIVDLLSLYDKRSYTLQEIKHRLSHGGYTKRDVLQNSLPNNDPRFPGAVIDESARATGLNQGIGTEALNTNSVTPRTVDIEGKYELGSLLVGSETGTLAYPLPVEDPSEALNYGEIASNEASIKSINVGYDRGVTGARDYRDNIRVHAKGISGTHGIYIENVHGETGSFLIKAVGLTGPNLEAVNYVVVDHKGSLGVNTSEPGWEGPDPKWNIDRYGEPVNIAADHNSSVRVRKDIFIDGNTYVDGDIIGESLRIPGIVSESNPATLGYTGIPQEAGLTGSQAAFVVKRGIAVQGVDGRQSLEGETGLGGVYECWDLEGNRIFTLGDMGEPYDRVVKTLYGEDLRDIFETDNSFLFLPVLGSIQVGDIVEYTIRWEDGSVFSDTYIILNSGYPGIEGLRGRIIQQAGLERGPFSYTDYTVDPTTGEVVETIKNDGYAYGVQIVNNPYSVTLGTDLHGRIIIKEMPEINKKILSVDPITVTRGPESIQVTLTPSGFFGSISYGGAAKEIKFAKMDLGPGADAWLVNGDVFFNSTGQIGRVTFSPNVIFRNNTFFYGLAYADTFIFNYATVNNLRIKNRLTSDEVADFQNILSVGPGSLNNLISDIEGGDSNLRVLVNGDTKSRYFTVESVDSNGISTGSLWFTNISQKKSLGAYIGGDLNSISSPFGLHIVDKINGILDTDDNYRSFTVDFSDTVGNYGNVDFHIRGDLDVSRHTKSLTLTSGNAEVDPDLALNVGGTARVNGTIYVEGIEYIGDKYADSNSINFTPVNVELVNNNTISGLDKNQNNTIITRTKKFTLNTKVNLDNKNKLGLVGQEFETSEGAEQYYEAMHNNIDTGGYFGYDTMTYTEDEIKIITGKDGREDNRTINVESVEDAIYQRLRFNRVNVATLGTLNIEWSGNTVRDASGGNEFDSKSVIRDYYLESVFFPSENLKWGADDHGNYLVNIQGSIVDNRMSETNIYTIDKSICLFISPRSWVQAGVNNVGNDRFESYVLYHPAENLIEDFNSASFTKQTPYSDEAEDWRVAVYPRFKEVSTVYNPSDGTQIYRGKWDVDIVLFPNNLGRVHNLFGELKFSYF